MRGATPGQHAPQLTGRISIHAPLAGCDYTPSAPSGSRDFHFNPRTPCGVRRVRWSALCPARWYFNPRTPCGVRQEVQHGFSRVIVISIHAPLAGCDQFHRSWYTWDSPFQSTHPLRGATASVHRGYYGHNISIHAPLAGCDRSHVQPSVSRPNFNPRPPCGVRRRYHCDGSAAGNFNPRTPCGVRRTAMGKQSGFLLFQSTHPLRGATPYPRDYCWRRCISIHAPLAGCDGHARQEQRDHGISIHAPLAGCDWAATIDGTTLTAFQSTHPLRGATPRRPGRAARRWNFNPRTPCGVRLRSAGRDHAGRVHFNPRTPCGVRPRSRCL